MIEELRNPLCTKCELHKSVKNICVMGAGNPHANIFIVGEAPGEMEDGAGLPFVGQSGTLLNETLRLAELQRSEVYITNVVKCRPPENRTPTEEEASACAPYLVREYQFVRPRYIWLLGNSPLHFITKVALGITKARGFITQDDHPFPPETDVYATFHPSAALRSKETRLSFERDITDFAKIARGDP